MADQFQAPPFRSEVVKDPEDLLKQNFFTAHWTGWLLQLYKIIRFSGLASNYQASLPGISVTITTAALTGAGTQGSMTFTNGILTSQTQAT
jgi:hypothetical protein